MMHNKYVINVCQYIGVLSEAILVSDGFFHPYVSIRLT